jgi:hypothetical protein
MSPLVAALVVAGLTVAGYWMFRTPGTAATAEGSIGIESTLPGTSVEIDGSLRGLTPLTVTLPAGEHEVVLVRDGRRQTVTVAVAGGVHRVHHVAWPRGPASPSADRGRLQVTTDPGGATVTVDGIARGITPLSIEELEPGEHEVVVQHLGRTERRSVVIDRRGTASLFIPGAPGAFEAGWLTARASTPLQVLENGRLIGTTESERITLPSGTHHLDFAADELGFRSRRTVTISAGQITTASVSLPKVPVSLNAEPWAEVWIEGKRVGETPLANLQLPIGSHQVTFRHPQLGEKRASLTVSLIEPARLAVDMRVR